MQLIPKSIERLTWCLLIHSEFISKSKHNSVKLSAQKRAIDKIPRTNAKVYKSKVHKYNVHTAKVHNAEVHSGPTAGLPVCAQISGAAAAASPLSVPKYVTVPPYRPIGRKLPHHH